MADIMQQSKHFRRMAIIVVAIVILVPVAAVAIFAASFNPDRYKPQIVAAVERATHRQLTIAGPLHMRLSLVPTISASGIVLANPPGFADADMATLKRVEARVALLPLLSHRIDIVKLVLVDPAITLEYGAAGQPNWLLSQPRHAKAIITQSLSVQKSTGQKIALQSVSIENGTITYKPPVRLVPLKPGATQAVPHGQPVTLTIAHFTGRADALDAPLHVSMQARYNSAPFTLDGTVGPVARLTGTGNAPWPVDVTLGAAGSDLHIKGSVAHPRLLRGYVLDLHATIPDLAALDPYLGGMNAGKSGLPPLKSVDVKAQLTQTASGLLPAISNASLTAGRSDLESWRKGLSIASLNATMASLDQPLNVAMAGQYQGKVLGLEGTAGPLGPILEAAFHGTKPAQPGNPATMQRFGINLAAKVGNAQFGVAGGIASPAKLAGVALKLTAKIPDLAHLSDLAGMKLPAWTNIGLSGLLTDPGGQGLDHAIGLDSLAVSSDQAQFGGAFSLIFAKAPDLQAVINAPRVDLTALMRAMPKPSASASDGGNPPAPAPAAGKHAGTGPLIPSTPLPFGLLRRGNGNVELTIGELMYDGATYDAITAHGLLQNGVLTVRPISAELPGGSVSGTLNVDATANPPRVHVTEAAPAFRLAPLLTLLGLPNAAGATVQLYADLAGQGNTPRGIAATLNGNLGMATVNGEVDGALLNRLFGNALGAAGLPAGMVGAQGPVSVRCFAARLDAKNGLASLRAFTLDSSRMYLTGTGTLDLGAERLNLVLRPQVRMGNGSAPVPVAINGTFRNPHAGVASPGAYGATAASLAQQLGGANGNTVLGRFARQLGIGIGAPPNPQSCRGALALARMGHPGPMPVTAAAPGVAPAQGTTPQGGPQNLLQSLFR
ncbi:AsmA family protein [Acidiphilium sp. AL]|uniref:AsmA family protein n=1 Tax=Acidiphilium sp. AL TaxID=2871704 RepID=UPI0021CB7249|nr:AsmA family protein [Acidiphilium sp. AL]